MLIKMDVRKKKASAKITMNTMNGTICNCDNPDIYLATFHLFSATVNYLMGSDMKDGKTSLVDAYDFDWGSSIAIMTDDSKEFVVVKFNADRIGVSISGSDTVWCDKEGFYRMGNTKIHLMTNLQLGAPRIYKWIDTLCIIEMYNNLLCAPGKTMDVLKPIDIFYTTAIRRDIHKKIKELHASGREKELTELELAVSTSTALLFGDVIIMNYHPDRSTAEAQVNEFSATIHNAMNDIYDNIKDGSVSADILEEMIGTNGWKELEWNSIARDLFDTAYNGNCACSLVFNGETKVSSNYCIKTNVSNRIVQDVVNNIGEMRPDEDIDEYARRIGTALSGTVNEYAGMSAVSIGITPSGHVDVLNPDEIKKTIDSLRKQFGPNYRPEINLSRDMSYVMDPKTHTLKPYIFSEEDFHRVAKKLTDLGFKVNKQ